jgi:hypothetical protein
MQVERTKLNDLLVDTLTDGSRIMVDSRNGTVYGLNATAGAAWDACSRPTTLSKVTEDMRRSLDPNTTEDLALEAILELKEHNLVTTSESTMATRRGMLTSIGSIALPIVASLTLAQQRAHAKNAVSVGCVAVPGLVPRGFVVPLQEPSPPPPTTTPCP